MHKVLKRILITWLLVAVIMVIFGRVTMAASSAGQSTADFLLVGLGARSAGMGGAFTAVAEGALASYWNPAGLTAVEGGQLTVGHFALYQDISLSYGSLARNLNDRTTIAASITFVDYGIIPGFDISGVPTTDLSAYDWAGSISLGVEASEHFSVGLTGRFINEKLDQVSASAFAADFALSYKMEKFRAAAVLANMGTSLKFNSQKEDLPATIRLGIAATPFSKAILGAVDIEKRLHGQLVVRQGIELNFHQQYFLRSGFNYYPDAEISTAGSGISFGAGARLNALQIDYAYTTSDNLTSEDLHRFSLGFSFK